MASDLLAGTRSRAEEAYVAAQNFADKATGSAVSPSTTATRSAQQLTSDSVPVKDSETTTGSNNAGGQVRAIGGSALSKGSRERDSHIDNESEEAKAVVAKDSSNVSPPTTSGGIVDSGPGQSSAAVVAARRSEDQSLIQSAESSMPEARQDRLEPSKFLSYSS